MRALKIMTAVTVSFLLAAPVHAQTASRIGSTAIATNAVSGSLGTTRRDLKRGDGVFREEMIATGAESRAQLLFADETALTIGPRSEIVLDKFVYDPDKKTGEVTLRAVTGAFRFVSGSAQKDAYKINTPAGSIGIRGTIIEFNIVPSPRGVIITLTLWDGAATFCLTPSQCSELTKPGTYIVIAGNQISAEQVLNAVGCGAGKCNEASYNQGNQTTYVSYLTDNKPTPPAPIFNGPSIGPDPGENRFQIALRAYLERVVVKLESAKERYHLQGLKLLFIDANIKLLNKNVDELIPPLDTAEELRADKRFIRQHARQVLDFVRDGSPRLGRHLHHRHRDAAGLLRAREAGIPKRGFDHRGFNKNRPHRRPGG